MQTEPILIRLLNRVIGRFGFAAVTAPRVDDSPGWESLAVSDRPHERGAQEIAQLYQNALTAWRLNPIAWRVIAITTGYVLGDGISLSSPEPALDEFIKLFWNHRKNLMSLRLRPMSDELARAGDLFVALFNNKLNGISYVRFVVKDHIKEIETAGNDWETELIYHEKRAGTTDTVKWLSADHPQADAPDTAAVILHYSINRPIGALMGEGDLTPMLGWLQRYSRMLEDRVNLNAIVRAFYWLITVPSTKVKAAEEKYRKPPPSGSAIVKTDQETWEVITPNLRARDAASDLQAVRQMIDAGSGYPPHWQGEPGRTALAEAKAMQESPQKILQARQDYFIWMLENIVMTAYNQWRRSHAGAPDLSDRPYNELFSVTRPDISRDDNLALAQAADKLASALKTLQEAVENGKSSTLRGLLLKLVMKFAGESQPEEMMKAIEKELGGETDRKTQTKR